ncbi:hypothetical protein L2E82_22326 [Cichorium intybus]|uniref:Uncharacterized protein n=1 Tax=Cichorium intybus TaxID=13427 RepID=A0ACB9DY65_CICIN|nr:hypothetical protein L2E82_22326 [Cichorium intybus]
MCLGFIDIDFQDLENFLMPLRFPSINKLEDFISFQKRLQTDHYKAAVKHLRGPLHSSPPAPEALLPLIQMLLLGDQVKEAIEEVESVVQISNATLPFRLKACLVEHVSNEDATKLWISFEDTLNKDPTCSHSLSKLITFHHDVGKIWLSQCDDDTMSNCGGNKDSYIKRSKNTPDIFKDNKDLGYVNTNTHDSQNMKDDEPLLKIEISDPALQAVADGSTTTVFLLGALAKLGATVVTYPLLVVKSRLQAKQVLGVDKKHQYKGTLDAILKMIRYEGLHGFYRGMSTKIVQSVIAAAVLFMVKEELVNGARWLLLKDAAKRS